MRAVESLARWPSPVLREPAEEVLIRECPSDVRGWLDTMEAVLDDLKALGADALAIAAPQVGVPKRLIAWKAGDRLEALVNPEVAEASDETVTDPEQCLSLLGPWDEAARCFGQGVVVQVERPARVVVEGRDWLGSRVRIEAEGLVARMLCHEIDHLDGLMTLDRVSRQVRREAVRRWAKLYPRQAA